MIWPPPGESAPRAAVVVGYSAWALNKILRTVLGDPAAWSTITGPMSPRQQAALTRALRSVAAAAEDWVNAQEVADSGSAATAAEPAAATFDHDDEIGSVEAAGLLGSESAGFATSPRPASSVPAGSVGRGGTPGPVSSPSLRSAAGPGDARGLDRTLPFALERAGDGDGTGDGMTLYGHAATFNQQTVIDSWEGRFTESIAPGAFTRSLPSPGTRGSTRRPSRGTSRFTRRPSPGTPCSNQCGSHILTIRTSIGSGRMGGPSAPTIMIQRVACWFGEVPFCDGVQHTAAELEQA